MDDLSNRLAVLRDQICEALKIDEAWPERNHQLCINLAEAREQFKDHAEFGKWLDEGGIKLSKDDRAAAISMGKEPNRLLEVLRKTTRRSLRMIYAEEWPTPFRSTAKSPPPRVTPEQERAAHVIQRRAAAGEPLDEKAVRDEAKVSSTPYRRAKAVHDAAVQAEKEIEVALSSSAQEKLEASIRAHKKKLDLEFEIRVMAEAKKRSEEMSIPHFLERLKAVERMLEWPRFNIMTPEEFNKIRSCLHPDKALPIHAEAFAEAFAIFNGYKLKIVREPAEDKKRAVSHGMPRTVEEMLARKKQKKGAHK